MPDQDHVMQKTSAPLEAEAEAALPPAAAETESGLPAPRAPTRPVREERPSARARARSREAVAAEPKTPEEAREAIERARTRISGTLDEIEQRLREKRDELKEKADISSRLREAVRGREVPALMVAIGAGFLVALLLGGGGGRRSGQDIVLSEEELEALRRWRKDRKRVIGALERSAKALEELSEE